MPETCRLLSLVTLAAALDLVSGCKTQTPPVRVGNNNSTILIGTDDSGKPEPHQPIAQNTVVNWRSPSKFSITFHKDKDPCVAAQTGHDDVYIAKDPSGSDPEYTLACTISNNPQRGDKFRYGITLIQAPSTAAPVPGGATTAKPPVSGPTPFGSVTGCGGCVLEVDSE